MNDVDNIISQLEQQRTSIDRAIAALREIGGQPPKKRRGRPPSKHLNQGTAPVAAASQPAPKKRRLSPEGRRRIAEALKRRWAAQKAAQAASAKATKKAGKKASKKSAVEASSAS